MAMEQLFRGTSLSQLVSTKVLVVDDDGEYLSRVWRSFARAGFSTVVVAADVLAGEKLIRNHRPQIALIDLNLGDYQRNGLSLVKQIKSEQAARGGSLWRDRLRAKVLIPSVAANPWDFPWLNLSAQRWYVKLSCRAWRTK
ncbi:MAG: response regulator [Bacilli bacterium]